MKAVVITGASTGIGRASALALDRNGFRVFAGVRKKDDGEALRASASENLTPVFLDVTEESSIGAAAKLVADAVGDAGLAGLVNNAGTTLPCPVEYLALDAFRRQLEVNLVGPLAVTKAFLPLLVRGGGRVVNVTSGAGKAGVPLMAPYVAAKHGLEGLSDVLRLEFGQLGVGVSVIDPGFVAPDMRGKLERDTGDVIRALPQEGRARYGGQLAATAEAISTHAAQGSKPDVVADAVLHALTSKKPRTRYPAGAGAKRMLLLRRVLSDRQFDRIIHRMSGLGDV
ncbi:D-beta-hydroxybutyrate dehydrogenase [Mycobacterium simulans]|uniref:D-beta-hydroxybutyrate dehydrogenase n=1 Tax=Mycobacterium simulans TaxID=627089 RepID=A0A7Z7N9R5_9MYCO|nr:SDR family NAD(P)-dependent oxidoreductase [Mycobacterium simulans]SOJ54096.1 D-beta-hydroxybutyrate dehydrogenase [Mycobacterium simulans]